MDVMILIVVGDEKYEGLFLKNIRSGRLRAFAFARLESLCCFYPSLDVWDWKFVLVDFFVFVRFIKGKFWLNYSGTFRLPL